MNTALLWSPEDIVFRFLESLATADFEIAERFLADEVTYCLKNYSRETLGEISRGRAAVLEVFGRVIFSEFEIAATVSSVVAQQNSVRIIREIILAIDGVNYKFKLSTTVVVVEKKIISWDDVMLPSSIARSAA